VGVCEGKVMQTSWLLNLYRGFLQTQFSKDWVVVMLKFWTEHWRNNVPQINLSTKLNIACAWCYRQLPKQGRTLNVTVAERSTRVQLRTTEMFYKHPPTALSSRQNALSWNNCRCCFWDFEREIPVRFGSTRTE